MFIETASGAETYSIARIYRDAFPASMAQFFPKRKPDELVDLFTLVFQLVLYWGGQVFLARDQQGAVRGYCIYSSGRKTFRNWRGLPGTALRLLAKLKPTEVGLLVYNQLLMFQRAKKTRAVPKKSGSIVSIAVDPVCQGQGIGTLLLSQALRQMAGESVLLNVRPDNTAARRLYEQKGFIPYGTTEDLSGLWLMLEKPGTD